MELKAFIKESLVEIGQAIHEANAEIANSPFMLRRTEPGKTTGIEFDVAVTTKETSGVKGGISVMSVGIGADRHDANESVSHIRFTVMMQGHVV